MFVAATANTVRSESRWIFAGAVLDQRRQQRYFWIIIDGGRYTDFF
jgi:hypothetical protein